MRDAFPPPPPARRWPLRGLVWLGLVVVFLAASTALYRYGQEVQSEIDAFAIANSDSLQWSLAQLEVEYYHMEGALARARADEPASLAAFARSFDIFYSRMDTVLEGQGFADVIARGTARLQIARIESFLAETAALIDAGPQAYGPALPQLRAQSARLAEDVRTLSLEGVREFAQRAKAQREKVFTALTRLATLTATLLTAVTAGFVVTWWLWTFGRRQALRLSSAKARLEAVIGTSLDAVIVVDQEARVIEFNGAAEKVFGYARDEALGARLSDLIVPEHLMAAHEAGFRRYRAGGAPRIAGHGLISLQARRKDGSLFPAELSVTATRFGRREIFVGFLRDITERMAAEQELIDARDAAMAAERAQSAFVAVMSHEMRTPLNGLLGTLEILRETRLSAKQRRFVTSMQQAGDILLQHVNNTLDVERLDAGKLPLARVPFDPLALIGQIVETQAHDAATRGNVLRARAVGPLPEALEGDPMRIRQVLLNLVGNATKFTRNGTITIEVSYARAEGMLDYRVIDTGIGIAPEETARIFDDFVTLDPELSGETTGSGLGLSIARRLVRAMRGTIGVESSPGKGSTFQISLPAPVVLGLAPPGLAAAGPAAAPAPPRAGHGGAGRGGSRGGGRGRPAAALRGAGGRGQ